MYCFRPDFALWNLQRQQQQHHHHHLHHHTGPQLMLRWLRTLSIDCSDVSNNPMHSWRRHWGRSGAVCCRVPLPAGSLVSQSALDRFTTLDELDVTWCQTITNVDFCAATLRVLHANCCGNLSNNGLKNATKLEVLHVAGCKNVTNVSPFAHSLLELSVSGSLQDGVAFSWSSEECSGIDSDALSQCFRLQVLDASANDKIVTLQPFAARLRELNAEGEP